MRPSLGFRMAGPTPCVSVTANGSSPEVFSAATAAACHVNSRIRCLDVIKNPREHPEKAVPHSPGPSYVPWRRAAGLPETRPSFPGEGF